MAAIGASPPATRRAHSSAAPGRSLAGLAGLIATVAVAALLRLIAGVGFANYDTLYALLWGQQLAHGQTPQYGLSIAPTPHPLIEALGLLFTPLGPQASEYITVALGFLALAGCGWLAYALGARWFGRAAGALAALLLLTRVPILSYGVRAYVDVPYMMFVLAALLVETRRRRAGAPVLVLLALAGLLRPEAWAFSGLYWLYVCTDRRARRDRARLAWLALLAVAAPLVWVISDWLVTGRPLWSLTNTRSTAETLGRKTGIGNVPEYIPRRVGEILRPPVLAGAALGGVLSLAWLRERASLGAVAGVSAVIVFAAMSAVGLPIDTRYAFLIAAILCVFCGVGVFGWLALPARDPRRRLWMAGGAVVVVLLIAYAPSQYRSAHREMRKLATQQRIQDELVALVKDRQVTPRCGPIGVPNHAPVPLLALYLKSRPSLVVSAKEREIHHGTYLAPASKQVLDEYILDRRDPEKVRPEVPAGFVRAGANRSWIVYTSCR
jgi:hypothetical protein